MNAPAPVAPTLAQALRFWWRLGWISFGGPAGQIAIMQAELVERRGWIGQHRFLTGLNFCMLLPGPEAQQLATYLGWRLHGVRGGIAAGALFILPSFLILWVLSYAFVLWGGLPHVSEALAGVKAAVIGLVVHALWRIGSRVLHSASLALLALLALVALASGRVPFPTLIAAAALAGWLIGRILPGQLPQAHARSAPAPERDTVGESRAARRAALAMLGLWFGVVALVITSCGSDSTLGRMAVFFSQAAVVTFGGAYAVLPYVATHAVSEFGWLDHGQMLVGMGLAESTPGPLIMVLEFVGFVGAWQNPGGLSPLLAATLGAAVTVAVTFLPSFAFVFAGAPHLDRIAGWAPARHALTAISAAVVGVIAHLAWWFGRETLRAGGQWNAPLGALALVLLLLAWRGWPVPLIVLLGALAGLAL